MKKIIANKNLKVAYRNNKAGSLKKTEAVVDTLLDLLKDVDQILDDYFEIKKNENYKC